MEVSGTVYDRLLAHCSVCWKVFDEKDLTTENERTRYREKNVAGDFISAEKIVDVKVCRFCFASIEMGNGAGGDSPGGGD